MMATFMLMMVPRSAVCGDRISEVLDTDSSVVPPADPVAARPGAPRLAGPRAASSLRLPRRRGAGAQRRLVLRAARADGRGHRLDRRRQVHAGQPGAAALRRHRRRGRGRRASTCATWTPTLLWSGSAWCRRRRTCSAAPSRSNLRHGKPDATDEELWAALEVAQARDFVEALPEGLDAPVAPGRHQLLRRPAPAAGDRAAAGPHARDLPVRRLVLGARPGHRRPAAGGAAAGHHRRDGRDRRPAGLHDHRRRPDPGARGRPGRRPRHPRRAARDLRDLPGDRHLPAEQRRRRHDRHRTSRQPAPPRAGRSRRPSGSRRRPAAPAAARWAAAWSARRR